MNYILILLTCFSTHFLHAAQVNLVDLLPAEHAEEVKEYLVKGNPHFLRSRIPPVPVQIAVPSTVSSSAMSQDGSRLLVVCNGEAWLLLFDGSTVLSRTKLLERQRIESRLVQKMVLQLCW